MNWTTLFPKALKPRSNRGRILLWACLASLIFGALEAGAPIEDLLRDVRNEMRTQPASGDIVLISIDDRSLEETGSWPWPRRYHGELAAKLHALGARRIFFDIVFASKSDPANDRALAQSLERLGTKVVLPVVLVEDPVTQSTTETYPLPEFRAHVDLAHINFPYTIFGSVRRMPYELNFREKSYPSFASKLGRRMPGAGEFLIDYSIDTATIPTVNATDVLKGKVNAKGIAGKDVIIGTTSRMLGDVYFAPGIGVISGVYLHILGAETLKQGMPVTLPWFLAFLPALVMVGCCIVARNRLFSILVVTCGISLLLVVPLFLEHQLIYVDILPALFLLTVVGISLSWASIRHSYRIRGTTNPVSGLPNLTALHQRTIDDNRALVAARVHNYAAIASTLPQEGEKALVEQITKRLLVGAADSLLYQGDEGIFAWFVEDGPKERVGSHLDALHTLFRTPIIVQDKQFDLTITFGLDTDSSRSTANRLASALVAADEAASDGAKWREYDASKLEDATWKLSLLSQLDAAIDDGDLWVAYQPKLDIVTGKLVGAEALARWTHPEKGPISPIEFILAAEQSNRIEKLTHFVLERAIQVAAAINEHGHDFNIAVNLSARLIDEPGLTDRIVEALAKHQLAAHLLTLEVTETAALSSTAGNLETLQQLRDLGIGISVDDYGTGMSTLDYLQRIPATEIKIDRSFVMAMRTNHATRVMVNSTIQLAHSLGQKVVAEGVEDQETLDDLAQMNCDLAQGYHIGRPMTFRALSKTMMAHRREAAA